MASRAVLFRIAKNNFTRRMIFEYKRNEQQLHDNVYSRLFHSLNQSRSFSSSKLSSPTYNIRKQSLASKVTFQRFGYSSNATSENNEKESASENNEKEPDQCTNQDTSEATDEAKKTKDEAAASKQSQDAETENDLSIDDLAKLLVEKEEQLVLKHKEVEKMQDKVLRSYAEMENVLDRTKREAENTKKFAIQKFAKSLLDVADNLGRASSVVKESFSKIDASKDSAGAVALLKTLLEGVEMTEKQLSEVFKKFGVEKFDPTNEKFDPHRHHAVFQIPDESKPSGTVAAVIKSGYMLYDRILRPAEVGVTEGGKVEESDDSSDDE